MFAQGSHTFAMFSPTHYVNGCGHACMYVTTFTRFAQKGPVGSMCVLYHPSMQVATLKPRLQVVILSQAVARKSVDA